MAVEKHVNDGWAVLT